MSLNTDKEYIKFLPNITSPYKQLPQGHYMITNGRKGGPCSQKCKGEVGKNRQGDCETEEKWCTTRALNKVIVQTVQKFENTC